MSEVMTHKPVVTPDVTIKYKRTHIPTGEVYTGSFEPVHGWEFGENLINRHDRAVAVRRAHLLLEAWNKQQPDTWSYKICLN